jgi:integrase/recombinase XerD
VIKASDFGLPQHRPRLFMVGFKEKTIDFSFPDSVPLKLTMSDILNGKCDKEIGFTIRTGGRGSGMGNRHNWDCYSVDGKERRLTVAEAKRMQGFPDDFEFPVSETQSMKQLGNSVAVPAIQAVAECIIEQLGKQRALIFSQLNPISVSFVEALSNIPESSVWLANQRSKETKRTYGKAVNDFINFTGIKNEDDWKIITQAHLIAWRNLLIENGTSPYSVNTKLSAISSLFKHFCEKRVVSENPVTGIKRLRINKKEVKTSVITKDQVRKMLDAPNDKTLKGLRDKTILNILFYCGCRISEVCSLKVKDFYTDGGYEVLSFIVKGGMRNKIAVNHEPVIVLNKYLQAAGHGDEAESPLILSVQRPGLRKHLNSSQVNRIFHKYADAVGLCGSVRPHTARATFITEALENKCPIEAVQKSVGHAHVSTTQMYDKRITKYRESAGFAVRY